MDRKSWLWRKKSSEKSPGETESSGSVSSHSERVSDDQDTLRASPNHTQSPEVSSNPSGSEANDIIKNLTEKLSAALLNIRAKEDIVKQHAKVAEEAVTGWEKAETESATLRQQLETAAQKKSALEDRVSHLDGALKECVRQLRQAREEQEEKIHEAIVKKTRDIESSKIELENQVTQLQFQLEAAKAEASLSEFELGPKLEAAVKENTALKLELLTQTEELKVMTLERDLSIQTAETASKQHLESIKKGAKLEAECRRLRTLARKASSLGSEHKPVCSVYVESLTDSQSDSGDRLNQVDAEIRKMGSSEMNECEPSCSDSWASALIAELDQFKNGKTNDKILMTISADNGFMDDFLEMERLAALPESENGSHDVVVGCINHQEEMSNSSTSKFEFEVMVQRTAELEEKLRELEEEKEGLQRALAESHDQLKISRDQLKEAGENLVELQKELDLTKESIQTIEVEFENENAKKKMVEQQLRAVDADVQLLRAKVGSLEVEIEHEKVLSAEIKAVCHNLEAQIEHERALSAEIKAQCQSLEVEVEEERSLSAEIRAQCQNLEVEIEEERTLSTEYKAKCQNLEDEIVRKKQEAEIRRASISNGELNIKQEKEFAVAAGKLAECQKTMASLGRQLKSLATLDDFLLDPEMLELTGVSLTPRGGEISKSCSNSDAYFSKAESSKSVGVSSTSPISKEVKSSSPPSSSSSSSENPGVEKNRNGIGKLFSRKSSSRIRTENQ